MVEASLVHLSMAYFHFDKELLTCEYVHTQKLLFKINKLFQT